MALFKTAEFEFSTQQIHDSDSALSNPDIKNLLLNPGLAKADEEIRQRFLKYANQLKRIAPKANDFLYFSCIMMHAAEAALIDQNSGELRKDACGNPISAEWVVDNKGSWKWKCSDSNLRPYKNNNGDIFPESELKTAYRKWIGRPLCKDHQSSSVDGIRGIIVDTYYDDSRKRVIALCALDKVNYGDLARKVSTGYANNVSMGTAVGRSICFECGNIATVESEYCEHVRNKTTYGEINVELSPIELSLVVTGADPQAKLRSIIASVNKYSEDKQERIEELRKAGCVTPGELERLENELVDLRKTVNALLGNEMVKEAVDPAAIDLVRNLSETIKNVTNPKVKQKAEELMGQLLESSAEDEADDVEAPYGMAGNKAMTGGHAQTATQDLKGGPPDINNPTGFDVRFASDLTNQINKINSKLDAMEYALRDLTGVQEAKNNKEGHTMSDKLRERAAARRAMFQKSAYFQGGGGLNEPQTYPKEPMAENVRNKEDKQMVGMYLDENPENLGGGSEELNLKKKLSRAEMEERKLRRHALLSTAQDTEVKTVDVGGDQVTLVKGADGKWSVGKSQPADELSMEEVFNDDGETKLAYFQGGGGVNEPQTYPKDPMAENVRNKEDKQMLGMYLDENPENMGGGAAELAEKKRLLRADQKLRAKFSLAFKNEEKTIIDKEKSNWKIFAGANQILEANGAEVYEDLLDDNWEVFASKRYGREVLRAIREQGLKRVAYLLKGDGVVKTAQPPAPPAPPMPEAPAPGGEEAMPPMDLGGEPEPEAEEAGEEIAKSPVDQTIESLTKSLEDTEKALEDVKKFTGDLKEAVQKEEGETEAELPSPAEADDEGEEECEADDVEMAASDVAEKVQEIYAALDESADELAMLAESLESRKKVAKTDRITDELLKLSTEALGENTTLLKEASLLTEGAKKKSEKEEKEEKKSKKSEKEEKEEKKSKKGKGKLPPALEKAIEEKKKGKKSKKEEEEEEENGKKSKGKKSKAELLLEELLKARASNRRQMVREAEDLEEVMEEAEVGGEGGEMDELKAKVEELMAEVAELKGGEVGEEPEAEQPELAEELGLEVGEEELEAEDIMFAEDVEMDLDDELAQLLDDEEMDAEDVESEADEAGLETSAAARKEWREKVAAEVGAKYQLSLDSQTTVDTDMPVGRSHSLEGLDTKTQEATFEGIVEVHEAIMKAVQNLPKVREAMDHLGGLLKSGTINVADLDDEAKLQALAVDPAAAKYWKDFWGQAGPEGSKFGADLVKEYGKKKAEASLEDQKIRLKRAYSLALDMQDKGVIEEGKSVLDKQVDDLVKLDDASFESLKRVVASVKTMAKTASLATSPALDVGVNSSGDVGEGSGDLNLVDQLARMWNKK
jgi:hypothetical protein